jgi:hypothetical protein
VLTGGNQKSYAEIRKLFEGFRKEFWSDGELNNKVINELILINII